MSSKHLFRLSAAIALAILATIAFPSLAPGAPPLRATLELKENRSTIAFLVRANEKGVLWQYTPDNPASTTTLLSEIVSIEYDDPEGWQEAVADYRGGRYAEAAPKLGKIADDYVEIITLKNNPAAQARYMQVEALRRSGNFDALAETLTPETMGGLMTALDERKHLQLKLAAGWAAVGKKNWDAVNVLIEENSEDGDLKKVAPRIFTQLSFMRGLSRAAAGEGPGARADFYRTAMVGYGNDRDVSGQAILEIMQALKADPATPENKTALRQLHALTYAYQHVYGGGTIPAGFEEHAKLLPPPGAGNEASEEPAAAPEDGAPAEGAPAAAPAESAESAAPPEGEGDAKTGETEAEGGAEAGTDADAKPEE